MACRDLKGGGASVCIIYKDKNGGGLYDLGDDKEGRVITFDLGFAWFTFEGETMKIAVEDIEQIIC